MSFPNYPDFAEEFAAQAGYRLYIADGYSEETNINNMIVQLLILGGLHQQRRYRPAVT